MKKYYLAFVIPLLINILFGETITVSGRVVDANTLKPLANVNIFTEMGGASSNAVGEFTMEITIETDMVTFSHIGY
jgi:hypothetical protein